MKRMAGFLLLLSLVSLALYLLSLAGAVMTPRSGVDAAGGVDEVIPVIVPPRRERADGQATDGPQRAAANDRAPMPQREGKTAETASEASAATTGEPQPAATPEPVPEAAAVVEPAKRTGDHAIDRSPGPRPERVVAQGTPDLPSVAAEGKSGAKARPVSETGVPPGPVESVAPVVAAQAEPRQAAAEIRRVTVSDATFRELDRRLQRFAAAAGEKRDGEYAWGVLNEYADPDRAARLLGGVLMLKAGGRFFRLVEGEGGLALRPVGAVAAAYGAIGLPVRDSRWMRRLPSARGWDLAAAAGAARGLWFLFPKRRAAALRGQVVRAFDCRLQQGGVAVDAAAFRREARLRAEVVVIVRPNGGRLGLLLPRYFEFQGERLSVSDACRFDGDSGMEWARLVGSRGDA